MPAHGRWDLIQSSKVKRGIKIYIKTARTCFGTVTPSSGSALFVLTEVTFVKTLF